MADPVTPETETPKREVVPVPAALQPTDPGITMTKAEYDNLQAEARRGKKAQRDAEKAADDRRSADLAAAGQTDQLLGEARQAREAADARADLAEMQLQSFTKADAIAASAAARGFTGEQLVAIKRLANVSSVELDATGQPNVVQVTAAVDSVIAQFPNTFGPQTPGTPAPAADPAAAAQPAAVPGSPPESAAHPAGYVSPEEYERTPWEVRYSAEFQERVTKSEPFWKRAGYDKVPANSFAVGQ